MKCTAASYDPSTGAVSVTFTIDENGTKMVSVKTLEDAAGARPQDIDAYSPEGAFYIKKENFKKGAIAVPGNASFDGNMDMSPWMALVFPIHFEADTQAAPLKLEVPDGTITFAVENGTWEDGTTDPKTVVIPMDVVETPDGYQAAGTLEDYLVPAGMKAAEGYDQATGKWVPELNTTENGIILTDGDGASASYTYVFEKKAEESKPDQPKPEQPKPEQPKPNKPSKPIQKPTVNKPNSVQTDAFTGLAAFMGLNGISAAGLWAALKRKKK